MKDHQRGVLDNISNQQEKKEKKGKLQQRLLCSSYFETGAAETNYEKQNASTFDEDDDFEPQPRSKKSKGSTTTSSSSSGGVDNIGTKKKPSDGSTTSSKALHSTKKKMSGAKLDGIAASNAAVGLKKYFGVRNNKPPKDGSPQTFSVDISLSQPTKGADGTIEFDRKKKKSIQICTTQDAIEAARIFDSIACFFPGKKLNFRKFLFFRSPS
jgi:hypothetical protein